MEVSQRFLKTLTLEVLYDPTIPFLSTTKSLCSATEMFIDPCLPLPFHHTKEMVSICMPLST